MMSRLNFKKTFKINRPTIKSAEIVNLSTSPKKVTTLSFEMQNWYSLTVCNNIVKKLLVHAINRKNVLLKYKVKQKSSNIRIKKNKQFLCELKISKSLLLFFNFFKPKLYRFPHKKWVALKRASWCDMAASTYNLLQ